MKWAALVARLLVGFVFFAAGMAFFLNLMPKQEGLSELAEGYMKALGTTGYMHAIKVFEVVGGLLLLAGRYVPLGVVLVAPVAVNVALYEVFLMGKPGIGFALVALLVVVIAGYWPAFRGLVAAKVA